MSAFLPSIDAAQLIRPLHGCCWLTLAVGVAGALHWPVPTLTCRSAEVWSVEHHTARGAMRILLHDKPFATYVFRDPEISRPYFANVFTPSGVKITRNHPPAPDDPQDHNKLHPGMWLAFGDLSGADSWRLAAPIDHVGFDSEPRTTKDTLEFAVENKYMAAHRQHEICREICKYSFHELPGGVRVLWDSTFRCESGTFVFGDQEELGLGVRLTKPVAVKSGLGGRILNSNGQKNEKEAWGQQADWCDYSGVVGNQYVGIMLMPHPEQFSQSVVPLAGYRLYGDESVWPKCVYRKREERDRRIGGRTVPTPIWCAVPLERSAPRLRS